jgi:hypothetical protein
MRENQLYFGANLEEHVSVSAGASTELNGKVRINPEKIPAVFLKDPNISNSVMDALKESSSLIQCQGSTHRYSLIDCDVSGSSIYPKYILSDYEKDYRIHGFRLYLSGFNDWIAPLKHFDIDDEQIKKSITIPEFNVEVKAHEGRTFTFSNGYNCDIKTSDLNDRQTIIDEYILVKVSWGEVELRANEIKDLVLKIQRFFSLLIGFDLNIEYVWLICKKDEKLTKWIPFYFLHRFHNQNSAENWREAIVPSGYLFHSNKWQTLFRGFFGTKNTFSELWMMLVAMMGYEGFWEYEILGLVSILNRYVEITCKRRNVGLNSVVFKALMERIIQTIDTFADENKLSKNGVVENVKSSMKKIRNSDTSTFNDQFKIVISGVDKRIHDILQFSESDFKRLKELRDGAAHGREVKRSKGDLTAEMKLKDKLFLLLLHFAYLDLGLTVEDQIECFYQSIHPSIRNADIDKKKLDLLSGHIREIIVKGCNLTDNKVINSAVLEYDSVKNEYRVNLKKTNEMRVGHKNPMFAGLTHMREWVKLLYPPDSISEVEWLNRAYITSDKDKTCLEAYLVSIVHLKDGFTNSGTLQVI